MIKATRIGLGRDHVWVLTSDLRQSVEISEHQKMKVIAHMQQWCVDSMSVINALITQKFYTVSEL